jgi:hypothetical protein
MSTWTDADLTPFAEAQEIDIAPVRRNGELRSPTIVWGVRVGDALYVRAAGEADQGWHGVARTSRRAQITAGGAQQDVTIDDADDPAILDQVDAAYRDKYASRYAGIVDKINDAEHRATTLRLLPAA